MCGCATGARQAQALCATGAGSVRDRSRLRARHIQANACTYKHILLDTASAWTSFLDTLFGQPATRDARARSDAGRACAPYTSKYMHIQAYTTIYSVRMNDILAHPFWSTSDAGCACVQRCGTRVRAIYKHICARGAGRWPPPNGMVPGASPCGA